MRVTDLDSPVQGYFLSTFEVISVPAEVQQTPPQQTRSQEGSTQQQSYGPDMIPCAFFLFSFVSVFFINDHP